MILHPTFVLPTMPGETPVGYASRLAFSLNCTLRALCPRIGIDFQQLLDGSPEAVGKLCETCQLPSDTFADTTYVTALGRRLKLAGQEFSVDQVNREALRICPVCIEQQISAGRRMHEIWAPREWHLTPLFVCHIHSTPILTVNAAELGRQRQDFAGLLQEAVTQRRLQPADAGSVVESGLGHHIRQRLRGMDDGHWLSAMPLYAAIKTADMIGVAAGHGVHKAWQDLSPAERFEAGRLGHGILDEGDIGLRNLFSRLQRDYSAETSTAGLLSTFGRIYVSMSSWDDTAFDPLRDVLRRHIVETMPFGPGDILLGKEVTVRRLHSARTAAPELGLSPVTARKRLRSIGVLTGAGEGSTSEQNVFDAKNHARHIRRLASALQRADAARYLGLKRLYEDVAPILDMIGSMNIDKTNLIEQVFAKEDLDAFLSLVLGKATTGPAEPSFEPIAKASRRVRTGIANVLDMILKGEITEIRLSPAHKGIMSVMVRKQDIFPALVARRSWVTMIAGAKAINMPEPTLSALVNAKVIPSKGASPMMLELADLEHFTRTYVSRWEVARQYRTLRGPQNRFSITKALAMAGLEPEFDEKQTLVKFYKRDSVREAFGPPPV